MTQATALPWEAKRTDETRQVEEILRKAGFDYVNAYRYNSASIRVRVIDSRFEGLSSESTTRWLSRTWSSFQSALRRTL